MHIGWRKNAVNSRVRGRLMLGMVMNKMLGPLHLEKEGCRPSKSEPH